jgi:hypothetical protein
MQSSFCLYVRVSVYPRINFWMAELVFIKLGMYIMARDPIWTATS